MPKAEQMGGGGGQHDLAPVTRGHLPKFSQEPQIVPPKAPPTIPPKLAVEPDGQCAAQYQSWADNQDAGSRHAELEPEGIFAR